MKKKQTKKLSGKITLGISVAILCLSFVFVSTQVMLAGGEITALTDFAKVVNGDKDIMMATLGYLGQAVDAGLGAVSRTSDNTTKLVGDLLVTGEIESVKLTTTGTTTPSVSTLAPIVKTATYNASSTLNVASDGNNVTDVIAYYTNTGADKLCTLVWYDITTAAGTLKYSFGAGTTTLTAGGSWTSTTTGTIIASTTISTSETFVTRGARLNNEWYPGTYFGVSGMGYATSTMFLLRNGESLVGWYNSWNATSSTSFGSENNRTAATLQANCWAR